MSEVHVSRPRLSVYIDYKSPAAFLAKEPTYALENEFGLEIDWKPLTQDRSGRRERTPVSEETKGERHARVRAEYVRMDQQRYAQAQGLTLMEGDGRVVHGDVQSAALEAGVFDVPSYSLDGEIFLGRQHLPMIRWLLSDRRGQPPV